MSSSSRPSSRMAAPVLLAGALATAVAVRYMLRELRKKSLEDSVVVTLPDWAKDESFYNQEYVTDEDKMALAIKLASTNVEKQTGGPFGCAIFELDKETKKNKLVSIGMNRVVTLGNSTLHGEVVAIQFAQKKLKCFSLLNASGSTKVYELYTSCEPCAMCLGATLWSGVSRIVCSATKDDALAIGFDEGPVYDSSYKYLEGVGIEVTKGVLKKEGSEVLRKYGETGVIYNR